MKRLVTLALVSWLPASPLYAALKPGAQAPDFTTQATLAGKPFTFALADALKSGPVVLFFTSYSDRTSYVIAPNGIIIYGYTALNPDKHVENTMAAVAKWQAEHKKGS